MTKNRPSRWRLIGFDTFSSEEYSLVGTYRDESAATETALKRLENLKKTQPDNESGGQKGGIQDQVWVIRPDGSKFRVGG